MFLGSSMNTIDHTQRQRALDPQRSCIVQAPAGSGKTALLVQRYLALLATAQRCPEEIIAITFTRKAAAEMRDRLIAALHSATLPPPTDAHALRTWHLARAALIQDQAQGWQLLQHPDRLRIHTIDALCHHLTRQLPLLSGLGALSDTTADARPYYLEAVERLFASIDDNSNAAAALMRLLLHLNNSAEQLQALLIHMLTCRDQWLPHLVAHRHNRSSEECRQVLEAGLRHIVTELLLDCQRALPEIHAAELLDLLRSAAVTLTTSDPNHPLTACQTLTALPPPQPEYYAQWQAISGWLLTQKTFTWRSQVDIRIGFPPATPQKHRMQALLRQLNNEEPLRAALQALQQGPPPSYSAQQWEITAALTELLPLLVAHLQLVFQERGVVDFSAVALAALQALEEQGAPTELALALDYQIRHILVDEFQDTSTTQFRLLEQLTRGWQPGDGRTLFLVGDPMQSIYRFRAAEVGLFVKAQQEGINDIPLEVITLSANFRSSPVIVDWINTQFASLFAPRADLSSGATPFHAAVATQPQLAQDGVHLHICNATTTLDQDLATCIATERAHQPDASIAILVRRRNQLPGIIDALQHAQIPFSAIEAASIERQSIIQDLVALTRALLNLSDRVAWLAVLRAPWCGLTLADLHALAGDDDTEQPILAALQAAAENPQLSPDGRQRALAVTTVLSTSIQQRQRLPLRSWVERTWRLLQGPACVVDANELEWAQRYFDLLEQWDGSSAIHEFVATLSRHYATTHTTAPNPVQVMTIHKAKGLEFDTVIIPHLQGRERAAEEQLLLWLDSPRARQANDLILAPIKSVRDKQDAIYDYIKRLQRTQASHELIRLLYVAATRAKRRLHLFAIMDISADTSKTPPPHSFLALLWPSFQRQAETTPPPTMPESTTHASTRQLRRLPTAHLAPICTSTLLPTTTTSTPRPAAHHAQIIGSVIHRCLQRIAQQGISTWHMQDRHAEQTRWRRWLLELALPVNALEETLQQIEQALNSTLADPRGQWILAPHDAAVNEYALTCVIDHAPQRLVLDRSFVADGVRWIIDYKTSLPTGNDHAAFLDQQQARYQTQLSAYAQAMQRLHPEPIRLGLYFPLWRGWREWEMVTGKLPPRTWTIRI